MILRLYGQGRVLSRGGDDYADLLATAFDGKEPLGARQIIALDVENGIEKWVTQLNEGDIFNHTMSGYDPNTGRYKDCSIGDTPKSYSIEADGENVLDFDIKLNETTAEPADSKSN